MIELFLIYRNLRLAILFITYY